MRRKVVAIYDVHGNICALDAVLADVSNYNVDTILFGGDLAWGPHPYEVMQRVMELEGDVILIRGNADREVSHKFGVKDGLDPTIAEINLWCANQLTNEQLQFLDQLPETKSIKIDGLGEVLFVHGSPRSDNESIRIDTPESEILMMTHNVPHNIIVCGHTHVQFERNFSNKKIINPGSVGLPAKASGACWAIIGENIELIETKYDTELAAEKIKASGVPFAEQFASHVLNPPYEGP